MLYVPEQNVFISCLLYPSLSRDKLDCRGWGMKVFFPDTHAIRTLFF